MSDCKHCWHDTGFGIGSVNQDGGESTHSMVCCWCDARKVEHVAWTRTPRQHGPHHPNRRTMLSVPSGKASCNVANCLTCGDGEKLLTEIERAASRRRTRGYAYRTAGPA